MGYKSKGAGTSETKGVSVLRKVLSKQTKAGKKSGGNYTGRRNKVPETGVNYSRAPRGLGRDSRPRGHIAVK